jgi:hypothetical protein
MAVLVQIIIPAFIEILLCTIFHNTLITLSSSSKESFAYCAVIFVLCLCMVSPRICKLKKSSKTGS